MANPMIPPDYAPNFLARYGWEDAQIVPLAGDASFRRYFRVLKGTECAVLMDAPPPHEDPRPFIAIADWLHSAGLVPPRILAADLEHGMVLLEDLGDVRMRETVDANPARERELYEIAVDVLVHLHRQTPMNGLPPHGLSEWLNELDLFIDWYGPAVGLENLDRDSWRSAWTKVLEPVANDELGPVVVLRDYHAENVMLVDGQKGIAHFGLLDFQDALAGHPAYDLVSILEDARRDVPAPVERSMLDRYIAETNADDRLERAYWALAAQRNTRILGVFCRLWKRDGKPHYRTFQPRMWGLLDRDLAQPGLEPVKKWFDANVPAETRIAFWESELA